MERLARVTVAATFVVAFSLSVAQLEAPNPKPIRGMRALALSPDGSRLAFVYKGDVWTVATEGGRAQRITGNVEMDSNPVWSPDGKWIAFSSNREGNTDTFVASSDGGAPMRLTFSGVSPGDWSPDGKSILTAETREDTLPGIYTVDVKSTAWSRVLRDFVGVGNPSYSPDGSKIVYTRRGFPWFRPRYQGSAASELYVVDAKGTNPKALRSNGFQHLWPRFGSDSKTIYTITVSDLTPSSSPLGKSIGKITDSADRTPNVYAVDLNGKAKRVTSFVGGGVRYLATAASKPLLAFEHEGYPYVMTPGSEPKKIEIYANEDEMMPLEERMVLTTGASNPAVSPDGKQIAFVARNEVWLVPIEKGKGTNKDDAKQLTDWPGTDGEPVWHPDGKKLFFVSDREGPQRLFEVNIETLETKAVIKTPSDVNDVRLTPDKKRLSFWLSGAQGGLFTLPVNGGEPKKVLDYPGQHNWNTNYAFSPDGRYLAYLRQRGDVPHNIFIFDTVEGKDIDVTRLAASHSVPAWSADGRYLYFSSNRDGNGVYVLPLREEEARSPELELKYEKPKDAVKVQIDFTDIHRRIRKLTAQPVNGEFLVDPSNGEIYFTSNDGDLWKSSFNGEQVSKVSQGGGVGMYQFFPAGNQILFDQSGTIQIYTPRPIAASNEGGKAKPAVQPGTQSVAFRGFWVRNIRAEQKAAFYQFWRSYNRNFYDPNFHGRDWNKIRERYEPLLESVGHRSEMANLLNMMVGELESSHSEVGSAPGGPPGVGFANVGFEFDYTYHGPGLKVAKVLEGTPASFPKTQIKVGEYVLAINGKDVTNDEKLYRDVLANESGRDLKFLVNSTASKTGAREVSYRSVGDYGSVVYRNRIKERQKAVEEASGGKIAYIHISGMGGNNFTQFNREAWSEILGKKAVIIDVRENGGGNISDSLIDILERVPHSYYQDRDGDIKPAPGQSWNLPTVVLHAESSYSNAEMFPYAMKARKLATLVGMPTPGYVIWTGGLPLVDGTSGRMPGAGVWRLDGTPLENMGQKPDIEVPWTTEQFFRGEDPQLKKAIEVLLPKTR